MTHIPINTPFWLEPKPVMFPPTNLALKEPDGLLAVGGALTPEWLLQAYSNGIFPWFNPGEPILWWTPNPRSVLFIDSLKIKRSLRKTIQKLEWDESLTVTLDQNFTGVMQACATVSREGQDGTWISPEMLSAYQSLHQSGHAHSVEVWQKGQLVGGLYGIAIGKMFFGESMFSKVSDSSKIALVALAMQLKAWGFELIDTQVETPHLNSLGASTLSRVAFEKVIQQQINQPFKPQKWQFSIDWADAVYGHCQTECKTP
ncbi:leucyl/phenylalanyl-tRNA--protein transferase [Thiomicrorhabdus arctica]|uniref:leucyl/phenylalanyl-tRNA--protein transferase n=1 Tax=Thiomicrorhabdus arctica TaxID=131540 RepID=UPI0003794858|nr:leucyl/phenylalanyl-tRNA--protein transferase [Thiomicrorhabdus arctica]